MDYQKTQLKRLSTFPVSNRATGLRAFFMMHFSQRGALVRDGVGQSRDDEMATTEAAPGDAGGFRQVALKWLKTVQFSEDSPIRIGNFDRIHYQKRNIQRQRISPGVIPGIAENNYWLIPSVHTFITTTP